MRTPTAADLRNARVVRDAIEQAWVDSRPLDNLDRHEEGGWVFLDTTTGELLVSRALAGRQASVDLSAPPRIQGTVVVGKFHTHPNPTAEGWEPGPSRADRRIDALHGVPDLIRADDGIHLSGPDRRRGGLRGGEGYPP